MNVRVRPPSEEKAAALRARQMVDAAGPADVMAAGMSIPHLANKERTPENVSAFFIDTKMRENKGNRRVSKEDAANYSLTALLSDNRAKKLLKVFLFVVTAILLGPYYLLPLHHASGDGTPETRNRRPLAVFLYCLIFLSRVSFEMLVFWERHVDFREIACEALFIIPVSLYSLAYGAAATTTPYGHAFDHAGGILFATGTFLNLWPEWRRHLFKKDPRNKGKLYAGSFYRFVRRPNYAGEILSFIGFALASGPPPGSWFWLVNQWIPLLMGFGLVFYSTPEIEFYLEKHYGVQWEKYVMEVKWKMLPGVW